MESKNLYKEDSIQSLSPREFTRLRPGVYCGSTEYSSQLLIEIVSNAIDEFQAGNGNIINVDYKDDGSCRVEDFAQGFPINIKRDDGETVLQASFDVLNTSGKFSEDGVYEGTALGLNGIGSKLTNFLSSNLKVSTYREGKSETIYFKDGIFESRELSEQGNHHTGTIVEWTPDRQFFNHAEIEVNRIKELFKVLTCLCPGLIINFYHNGSEKIEFSSKNGLNDLIDNKVKDTELLNNRLNINYVDGKNKLNLVLTYTSNYSSNIISYVNTGETDSGPHITQIKTIITREFNKFFREKKWLKDKDSNLEGNSIQEGMLIAFNLTAPGVSYDAQTKSRIVKLDMSPFTSVISDSIQTWLNYNEKDIKIIFDKAMSAKRAAEAAKKARELARNSKGSKSKGLKAKMALSSKFIDCASKNPNERNLLLVEGLSAGSSAIEARNAKTDCIYMLRGKIISPLKTSMEKILANQEMSDIIKVIGAGFGNDNFDISKMNFDKIVMTTDADSDGSDIELLLITFFFTYMKPLVEAGKLYRAVTPLYIVRAGKEELYFYTEEEMDDYRRTHSSGYEVLRAKGLGELNAADLHKVCFENQRFKRITISDAEATKKLLDTLQGPAVAPRKQFIYDNAEQLGFEFD